MVYRLLYIGRSIYIRSGPVPLLNHIKARFVVHSNVRTTHVFLFVGILVKKLAT